jgi:hypothetical protein
MNVPDADNSSSAEIPADKSIDGVTPKSLPSNPRKHKKPVRNYQRHTKTLIAQGFSEIMEAMAQRSIEGSLAHTKFLFEIGGVKEDIERKSKDKREPSLATLLLAEVRRRNKAQALAAKRSADGVTTTDDSDCGEDERGDDCGLI